MKRNTKKKRETFTLSFENFYFLHTHTHTRNDHQQILNVPESDSITGIKLNFFFYEF